MYVDRTIYGGREGGREEEEEEEERHSWNWFRIRANVVDRDLSFIVKMSFDVIAKIKYKQYLLNNRVMNTN